MRMAAYYMIDAVSQEPVGKALLIFIWLLFILNSPMHAGYNSVGRGGLDFGNVLCYYGSVYTVDYVGCRFCKSVGTVCVV